MLILKFFILLLFLLCVRTFLSKRKEKESISIGNEQTIGNREEQQDSFSTIITENGVMAILADGMGGYENGKVASDIAVNTFIHEFSKLDSLQDIKDFFIHTAMLSNKKIIEKSKKAKMGTTLVVAIIKEDLLYWASIGDSAIALFRNEEFLNLNKKQIFESILQEQYLCGQITKQEMKNHPMKKRLTNYIGHDDFKDIEIGKAPIKLRRGEKVVLCSDGIYNSMSELEMEKILMKNKKPHKASEEIIDRIEEKNYLKQDNATIIILQKNN